MPELLQVITTAPTQGDARQIAQLVVARRLAGCAQILGPIESTYWWHGTIETAPEWLCLIKSRADLFDDLAAAIRAIHPYQTPEILAVPIVAGAADYLAWLRGELRSAPASGGSGQAASMDSGPGVRADERGAAE